MPTNKNEIIQGSALEKLKELPSESVDCCITSPPYWALRDYKIQGQLGLEPTFIEYIAKLIEIFNEVKRVLKKEGSCWVDMGDTYNSNKQNNIHGQGIGALGQKDSRLEANQKIPIERPIKGIGEKSLCLIPQRFSIAMVDQGWICRNTIIWYKPNCMPSSAKDRFTVDFEYLFFFVKNQKYYFDTQYEPIKRIWDESNGGTLGGGKSWEKYGIGRHHMRKSYPLPTMVWPKIGGNKAPGYENPTYSGNQPEISPYGRIKRCVWKIPTQPFSEAHFAVFPPELVETPIKATCPVEGTVIDPFLGSGTTAIVAMQNARNFVGIELNPEYIKMANARLEPYLKQERLQFG